MHTHGPPSMDALYSGGGDVPGRELVLKVRTGTLTLGRRTLVMGILNVTPDSFSDGGVYFERERAVERGLEMVRSGADIIDVGGESSRPGAEPVDLDEELRRVVPVVEALAKEGVFVSVDTTKSPVAREALRCGAEMINDISALRFDPEMARVCARFGASVVLMHMRGDPRTMQSRTDYTDLVAEISEFLRGRMDFAVSSGIERERIVLDPGIGFAKTVEGNLEIIKELKRLGALRRPLLLGPSRKSFIGAVLGLHVSERLTGTIAALSACILNGAHIVRVHDVKEARQAADLIDAVRGPWP